MLRRHCWPTLIAAVLSLAAGGCASLDHPDGEPHPAPGGDCVAQRNACVELCRPRGVAAFACAETGEAGTCECLGGEGPGGAD